MRATSNGSGEQYVSACPQNTAEGRAEEEGGNVIVVCRRLGPANGRPEAPLCTLSRSAGSRSAS